MKAKLEFDLDDPSERLEHERCIKATKAYIALHEIGERLFRPARKHGYSDPMLNNLLETSREIIGGEGHETKLGFEVVSKLEDMFYQILQECDVDLDILE